MQSIHVQLTSPLGPQLQVLQPSKEGKLCPILYLLPFYLQLLDIGMYSVLTLNNVVFHSKNHADRKLTTIKMNNHLFLFYLEIIF